MDKAKIWQIVFYISWSIVALWLVLKVIGVIQTPVWLEYGVPISGLLVGVLALFHNILDNIKHLAVSMAHVEKDVDYLKKDVRILQKDITFVTTKIN